MTLKPEDVEAIHQAGIDRMLAEGGSWGIVEFAAAIEAQLHERWFARPLQWQVRTPGDAQHSDTWERTNDATYAREAYGQCPNHTDGNGFEYRPVFAAPPKDSDHASASPLLTDATAAPFVAGTVDAFARQIVSDWASSLLVASRCGPLSLTGALKIARERCTDLRRTAQRSRAADGTMVDLPPRVIDRLFQAAGVSTCHPDGDQLDKLHAFARNVVAETLARLPSSGAPAAQARKSAMQRYEASCCAAEEPDPIERLRFYCGLAFTDSQDSFDVAPFFDALIQRTAAADAEREALQGECTRLRNDLAAARQEIATAWDRHAMANRLSAYLQDEQTAAVTTSQLLCRACVNVAAGHDSSTLEPTQNGTIPAQLSGGAAVRREPATIGFPDGK